MEQPKCNHEKIVYVERKRINDTKFIVKVCAICGINKSVKFKSVPQNSTVLFLELEQYEKIFNELNKPK